jgi:hypothetical protein
VASGAFALAIIVGLGIAVGMSRHRRGPSLRLQHLLVVQLVGFAALEVGERAAQSVAPSSLLGTDALFALLLQLPVAILVFSLTRRAIRAVERLFERRRARPTWQPAAPARTPASRHHPASLHWALTAGRRGPPPAALIPT